MSRSNRLLLRRQAVKNNEGIVTDTVYLLFQWGARAFKNMMIVPPGSGIVHQVNLEYLARVVFDMHGWLYPDSLVGTDSHTTMINGLGVLGWGKILHSILHVPKYANGIT